MSVVEERKGPMDESDPSTSASASSAEENTSMRPLETYINHLLSHRALLNFPSLAAFFHITKQAPAVLNATP